MPCTEALQDLLDDAARISGKRNRQLGWWEDKMFYPLDGPTIHTARNGTVIIGVPDADLEPPGAG